MPYIHYSFESKDLNDFVYDMICKYHKGKVKYLSAGYEVSDSYGSKRQLCRKNLNMVKRVGSLNDGSTPKNVYLLMRYGDDVVRAEYRQVIRDLGGKNVGYLSDDDLEKIDIVIIVVNHGLGFDGTAGSDYDMVKKAVKQKPGIKCIFIEDLAEEFGLQTLRLKEDVRISGKYEYEDLDCKDRRVSVRVECPLTDSWIDRDFRTAKEQQIACEAFHELGADYFVDPAEAIMYIISGLYEENKAFENIPEKSKLSREEQDKLAHLLASAKCLYSYQSIDPYYDYYDVGKDDTQAVQIVL